MRAHYKWEDFVIAAEESEKTPAGEAVIIEQGFLCPKCNSSHPSLNESGRAYCPTCDVTWVRVGDRLEEDDE